MILFLEDWKKYPHAIVDIKTSNKSFLRLAGLLKKMKIKNHAFLLALHNPMLQGIDPYDPNLTEQQMIDIAIECRENPWYFFREVARIPPPAGSNPIPLKANRANIALFWLFFNHITTYLIQPRQTGKSINGDLLKAYLANVGTNNSDISLVTKDDKLRTKTSAQIKELIEILPPYLQFMNKKDIKNSERLTVRMLGNKINLYVGQKDKKAADNLGRGMTSPIVHIDEFAYIYNIDVTLPTLLSATTAAREIASENNAPYGTLFTTTPGKLNTKEGMAAHDVYSSSLRWSERFYDSRDIDDLNNIINKNTKKFKIILLEFNHRQLGFTDQWLRERLEAALSEGDNALSDFFNKWVAGNTSSPIPKALLDIIVKSRMNPRDVYVSDHGYVINWYVDNIKLNEFKKGKKLVIGLDTSDALGGKNDDIGLVIRDISTGEVIGVGKYNETNLATFADFLVELLETYPNAVLIPERRSSATAILDFMYRIMLIKRMNPFKRIFNWVVDEIDLKPDLKKQIIDNIPTLAVISKYKREFGFATSGNGKTSRGLLYGNVFRSSVNFTADKVRDKDLIDQLAGLTIRNGKLDHDEEGHDDLVISWLLGFWFLQYAKNKKVYNIKDSEVLNLVIDQELKADNPDISRDEIKEQEKLKEEIERLANELKNVNNEIVGIKIMNKIYMLYKKINTKVIKSFNIENILSDIKMYKKIKKVYMKDKKAA